MSVVDYCAAAESWFLIDVDRGDEDTTVEAGHLCDTCRESGYHPSSDRRTSHNPFGVVMFCADCVCGSVAWRLRHGARLPS